MQDLHALAAPYALDALDAEDRADFDHHLVTCEGCRTEIEGYLLTAGRLAEAVGQAPPAGMRAGLLVAVRGTRQVRPVVDLARHRRLRRTLPRLVVAAAVALGAVGVGGFAFEHGQARDDRVANRSITTVLAAPDASTKARALGNGGNVRLVASATRDTAVIAANDLPALAHGAVYQVWMLEGASARSQGTFRTDGSMILTDLESADQVAVTVEPRGGSTSPTTLPVVALDV